MNNSTADHLGTATNPINQDRKWTAKKSYPLSMPLISSSQSHAGCILARLSPAMLLVYSKAFLCCLQALLLTSWLLLSAHLQKGKKAVHSP